MKVAILLKSGPDTAETERTLTMASDMLTQGHAVTLCLLQDSIHLCRSGADFQAAGCFQKLLEKQLAVQVLKSDCHLRGIDPVSETGRITACDYSSIVDLIESADRTIGIL